ncbi:hypothetical protein [Streptomyces asiaticus]|uniref:hypothetical protein n=1 Tax=Streptomyces asiaticus TaxID=114695 RepID=UPI00380257B5
MGELEAGYDGAGPVHEERDRVRAQARGEHGVGASIRPGIGPGFGQGQTGHREDGLTGQLQRFAAGSAVSMPPAFCLDPFCLDR